MKRIKTNKIKIELKKQKMESVSTPRNILHALRKDVVDKSVKNVELQTVVNQVRRKLQDSETHA